MRDRTVLSATQTVLIRMCRLASTCGAARCRALSCVALRCGAGSGWNEALVRRIIMWTTYQELLTCYANVEQPAWSPTREPSPLHYHRTLHWYRVVSLPDCTVCAEPKKKRTQPTRPNESRKLAEIDGCRRKWSRNSTSGGRSHEGHSKSRRQKTYTLPRRHSRQIPTWHGDTQPRLRPGWF